MRILFVMYELNNLGGIINFTEQLGYGFRDLGHTVDFVQLRWAQNYVTREREVTPKYIDGFLYPYNQDSGWLFPNNKRIPYKGQENLKKWKQFASKFDLLIWLVPVPTMQKQNAGNTDWLSLYDVPVKQLCIVHDGNLIRSYPYISALKPYITGLVGVHPCGYNSALCGMPRTLIFNPQDIPEDSRVPSYQSRKKGFVSLQTFKRWKRVDDLVRAIPYIDKDIEKNVIGYGMELAYMTSLDKCKEEYKTETGERIWDIALANGMKHEGFIHPHKRDKLLRTYRTLIDSSWSKAYSGIGDHFNRVTIEAIIQGAIPIARNFGVSTNVEGNGLIFKANKNYVMIPWDATPQEFAEIVNYANNMSSKEAMDYMNEGYSILYNFDRRFVAEQYLAFSNRKPSGVYNKVDIPELSSKIKTASDLQLTKFFGYKD